MTPRLLLPAIFLIGAATLGYQLALMRVFAIAQWHHFAYMIISIAMLGFGASGTALALIRRRIGGYESLLLRASALSAPISIAGCYAVSQHVPFETFQLVSRPSQLWNLLALYVILAAPFFLAATCIAAGFLCVPGQVGRLYAWNMLGSGVGAAGATVLMYYVAPQHLPAILAVVAALGALLLYCDSLRLFLRGGLALLAAGVALVPAARTPIRVSEYKALSYALQAPDARVVAQAFSPLSVVTAVSSKLIRETPGQISNYPMEELGPLPAQIGLFFDAGAVSPVNRFDGSLKPFAYLDYVTEAAPYHLVDRPNVLILGMGGGTDVLGALAHGARRVTAVEVDPGVFTLLRGPLADFSGRLLDRPEVNFVLAEGRGFLQSHADDRYDLIHIALLDSLTASAAGVHALNESYLYTVEALTLYLNRLTPCGVLSITRWLETPPRDALKMFATAVEACERLGARDPARHLIFIRTWNTATIAVSRSPLTGEQVRAVRDFCERRGIDLCYCPGIEPEETNRFTILERPDYYEFAQGVLSPHREEAYRNALFHLRPAIDDRPHFFRFFKWSSLPVLLKRMGTEWIPFVEWGYVTLVATLIQGAVVSVLLIVLPLLALGRGQRVHGTKRWVILYFGTLGLAYMFLEIAFIQKLMLFLAYPVYAVAVVLTAFLAFSGLGSLLADRVRKQNVLAVTLATVAIAGCATAAFALERLMIGAAAGWPDWAKIVASVAALAPLAFCMGIPFPAGLQVVSGRGAALLPWAWGINGCASVVGASLATLIAIHLGFRLLAIVAILIYFVAAAAFVRLTRVTRDR